MDLGVGELLSQGHRAQRCPHCEGIVESDAINVAEGLALCPRCGRLSRLSELILSHRSINEVLGQPPPGCAISVTGRRVIVTASLRSLAGVLFPAAFALFWNAIVSVFAVVALAGLYANLIGPLPVWFPLPGLREGKPEMNGQPMDLRTTLFLWLFLIPFIMVGLGMTGVALLNLLGKVEVAINELDSYVATGVGIFKWKRRFDFREVRGIRYGSRAWQSEGGSNQVIEMSADRTIKFGSLLPEDRMEWLRAVLKTLLLHQHTTGV